MQSIIVIYTKSANISFNDYFLLTNIIWSCGYRNHGLFPIDDDFRSHVRQRQLFSLVTQHLIFLLFEDKGRLHAKLPTIAESGLITAGTISIKWAWAKLSRVGIAWDPAIADLAYLIAGFGHNYPVPSSPPHAPRSGAHWPNRME